MIQYEGVRYALESNRCRAFQNCGSILWQFNEPWPNVSCTNIWDYYGKPKAAYYAVQAAYRPVAPVLKYDTLFPKAGEAVILRPFICNDGEGANGVFQISVSLNGVEIQTASGQTTLCANGPTKLESLTAVPMEKGYMEARLTWTDEAGNTVESVYPFFVVTEGGDADRQYAVRFVNSLMKSKE